MTTITVTRDEWTAIYSGGPYIDLYVDDVNFNAINVFDYATGKAALPFTAAAVGAELDGWLADNEGDLDSHREYANGLAHMHRR